MSTLVDGPFAMILDVVCDIVLLAGLRPLTRGTSVFAWHLALWLFSAIAQIFFTFRPNEATKKNSEHIIKTQ